MRYILKDGAVCWVEIDESGELGYRRHAGGDSVRVPFPAHEEGSYDIDKDLGLTLRVARNKNNAFVYEVLQAGAVLDSPDSLVKDLKSFRFVANLVLAFPLIQVLGLTWMLLGAGIFELNQAVASLLPAAIVSACVVNNVFPSRPFFSRPLWVAVLLACHALTGVLMGIFLGAFLGIPLQAMVELLLAAYTVGFWVRLSLRKRRLGYDFAAEGRGR